MHGSPSEMLLIDGIGPFFRYSLRDRINWSKIPFSDIEKDDGLREECRRGIPEDFRLLVSKVAALGYTAVTLDDVAHLVGDSSYPAELKRKLESYRSLYRELFAIAAASGLGIFVTTDFMFYNPPLQRKLGRGMHRAVDWLGRALDGLFAEFPAIAGVIVRIGETDGVDVRGDFRSRMMLRKPYQARRFIEHLLPVFESHGKQLVFRTWTVGAHRIGDLIWNPRTFGQVFGGIASPSLVISMKYGETDFFRNCRSIRCSSSRNTARSSSFRRAASTRDSAPTRPLSGGTANAISRSCGRRAMSSASASGARRAAGASVASSPSCATRRRGSS